jgi:hypothetical protein
VWRGEREVREERRERSLAWMGEGAAKQSKMIKIKRDDA